MTPDPHRVAVAFEEAVTSLAYRAKLAGIPNADDWAREFIDALRHRGWRPHAPVTALPRRDSTHPADPARVADLAADARAVIRATRQTQPAQDEGS